MKIGVFGNCQSVGMADSIKALLPDAEVYRFGAHEARSSSLGKIADEMKVFASCDHVFFQPSLNHGLDGLSQDDFAQNCASLVPYPLIATRLMQPDCHYLPNEAGVHITGPLGPYQSAIAAGGFLSGLSVERTVALFNVFTYRKLGYLNFDIEEEAVSREARRFQYDFSSFLAGKQGRFMHTINHPAISIIFSTAKQGLTKIGLTFDPETEAPNDSLAAQAIWPIYSGIARSFNSDATGVRFRHRRVDVDLSLPEFVYASFDAFSAADGKFRSDLSDKVAKYITENVQ